eukprot:scaffold59675_cov18-Tisochrysis_lutea.AAC.2
MSADVGCAVEDCSLGSWLRAVGTGVWRRLAQTCDCWLLESGKFQRWLKCWKVAVAVESGSCSGVL